MSSINQIKREIKTDIQKITEVLDQNDYNKLREVHMFIDSKYQDKIDKWGLSQYGWTEKMGFIYNSMANDSLKHNLENMKGKLEGHLQKISINSLIPSKNPESSIKIYNENNVSNYNINIDFKIIEQEIKESESLTDEQTKEALVNLKYLKEIYNSNESRKSKWEKSKTILAWLADKSVDVAIAFLPIIMNSLYK